ncbi:hypothetical protein [Bradyrhizobium sp. 23]|uniref:hypothetical protein n=1 Tax=Bradyrhizobium sp. 23 TaxID=2782667 RepID=UPI001FFA33C0|nr:hypothetical protein [Bradyrhizobium sp. 23]MCK1315409.1 hypothetical protein [Bradyrhizobium sp. 23]
MNLTRAAMATPAGRTCLEGSQLKFPSRKACLWHLPDREVSVLQARRSHRIFPLGMSARFYRSPFFSLRLSATPERIRRNRELVRFDSASLTEIREKCGSIPPPWAVATERPFGSTADGVSGSLAGAAFRMGAAPAFQTEAMMTDDEIIKMANDDWRNMPHPLKMAAISISEARDIARKFSHSSLPLDAHPEYIDVRQRIDGWVARWKAGNHELAGPLGIDLNASLKQAIPSKRRIFTLIGRIFWSAAILGPPVIYVIMLWWRWWLS